MISNASSFIENSCIAQWDNWGKKCPICLLSIFMEFSNILHTYLYCIFLPVNAVHCIGRMLIKVPPREFFIVVKNRLLIFLSLKKMLDRRCISVQNLLEKKTLKVGLTKKWHYFVGKGKGLSLVIKKKNQNYKLEFGLIFKK